MKKFMKGIGTLLLLIIMGGLNILEICIEMVYQIVRLIRRGFRCMILAALKKIDSLYKGKVKVKSVVKDETGIEGIRIYEIID